MFLRMDERQFQSKKKKEFIPANFQILINFIKCTVF